MDFRIQRNKNIMAKYPSGRLKNVFNLHQMTLLRWLPYISTIGLPKHMKGEPWWMLFAHPHPHSKDYIARTEDLNPM